MRLWRWRPNFFFFFSMLISKTNGQAFESHICLCTMRWDTAFGKRIRLLLA